MPRQDKNLMPDFEKTAETVTYDMPIGQEKTQTISTGFFWRRKYRYG
jgi:hypothetical protein